MSLTMRARFDVDYTIANEYWKHIVTLKIQIVIRNALRWTNEQVWFAIILSILSEVVFDNDLQLLILN